MHISAAGLLLIEEFEGFSSTPYDDGTGVMTIGYGTTEADVSPLPRSIDRQHAQALLARKLAEKYEPAVNGLGVPLNQHQFDALVSLAYNVGPGVMGWQIGRDLRARNYRGASADFMHYVYAGGRVLQGLVNRRRAEQQLFNRPVVTVDVHHYDRYPIAPSTFGRLRVSERATVVEYDRRYPFSRATALRERVLRAHIRLLRDSVWRAAHASQPPDWQDRHRGWRWQKLNDRLHGRVKL